MIFAVKNILDRNRLRNKSFGYIFEPYDGNEVVALDTETTGLNPKKDSILSIGAVIIRDGKIVVNNAFERFISPDSAISEESIKIHHIRACDLENGVRSEDAIKDLIKFISNRPIVGYYIDFDRKMISKYTRNLFGFKLPNQTIELSSMYYRRYRKESSYEFVDLKFDTIMEKLALPRLGKHDALNDALMSAMMYLKLLTMAEYKGAYS